MRIAVSGSHATGKSTLVNALVSELPGYEAVPEVYSDFVDEGYLFSYPPALEDFELQLQRSISNLLENTSPRVLFDRCPVDYLAYLAAWKRGGNDAVAASFPAVADAMAGIELVIFVPIENPDRIDFSELELPRLRRSVDLLLHKILIDDLWGFGVNVLAVTGSLPERISQVVDYVRKTNSTAHGQTTG
jgi:hypothetical protein